MTLRAFLALLLAFSLLFIALSLGQPVPLYAAAVLFIALATSFLSALIGFLTLRVSLRASCTQALRGEASSLWIDVRAFSPLPLAPVVFTFAPPDGGEMYSGGVQVPYLGAASVEELCVFPHVGTFECGLKSASVSDAFSLFRFTRSLSLISQVLVLPRIGDAQPMPFSPGDDLDVQLEKRARDDATLPADVRAYQQGDELKRVHWKLSLRKRQLMVRTFEVPARPDALLLVDCAMPEADDADTAYALRDAICESAVSLAHSQLSAGHAVHMPLNGRVHIEAAASGPADLPHLQRQCALCDFEGDPQFERVLLLETRRLRRTGATAIITTRLTPRTVDLARQIQRMGPCVRFVYVCAQEPDEMAERMISRLEKSAIVVQVTHCTDAPGKESA